MDTKILHENGTKQLEEITGGCDISPEDVSLYLIDMEMEGLIESKPGGRYCVKE